MVETDAPTPAPKWGKFAQRLEQGMAAKGIKVSDVVGALGISSQMVGKYLRGESLPGPVRLGVLARMIDMDPDQLIEATGDGYIQRARSLARNPRPDEIDRPIRARDVPMFSRGPRDVQVAPERPSVGTMVESTIGYMIDDALAHFPGALYRMLRGPIDQGALFPLRPDIAITGRDGWKAAIEIKPGAVRPDALAGFAYNWRKSTNGVPLFLVIAGDANRRPMRARGWDDDGELMFDHSRQMPLLPDRNLEAVAAMRADGLFADIAVVAYDFDKGSLNDNYPDQFKLSMLIDGVVKAATT